MADFETAFRRLIQTGIEGTEYSDRPDDPGGPTRYGITQKSWDAYLESMGSGFRESGVFPAPRNVRDLTEGIAASYYLDEWWVKGCYQRISDQRLATLYFISAVNMGEHRATELLQEAANHFLAVSEEIAEDGRCGPKTLGAINTIPESVTDMPPAAALVSVYADLLRDYYRSLHNEANEKGWLNRVDRAIS